MVSRNQDVISQNNRSQDIPIFYFEFLQIYLFFLRCARDVGEFDICFRKANWNLRNTCGIQKNA